jgi:hypothetical protein
MDPQGEGSSNQLSHLLKVNALGGLAVAKTFLPLIRPHKVRHLLA